MEWEVERFRRAPLMTSMKKFCEIKGIKDTQGHFCRSRPRVVMNDVVCLITPIYCWHPHTQVRESKGRVNVSLTVPAKGDCV